MKRIKYFIALLITSQILTACSSNKDNRQGEVVENVNNKKVESNSKIEIASDPGGEIQDIKLFIKSGCRGCGRCVRADSEHFGYDYDKKISQVISQENLSSINLQKAMRGCPAQVIKKTL